MNFGIIGFGRIARKFVQAIEATEEGKIYALSSRSVSMDDPYLKEHPEVKVYKDYEELLNDPQVDAVYIALTHKFHKEWILRSLEHHIPVLSEKPLVLTSTDVDEIQEKVKKTNTLCTEALKTKFNTGYDHLKEDLKKIGNIQTIYANFCSDSLGLPKTSFLFDKEQGGALKLREKILKVSIIISDQRFILKMDASQPPKVQSIEKWIDMQKSSELKERS